MMLIVCPTCATTYQIQLAALGAAGRTVRCTRCKNAWFATLDSTIDEATLAAAAPVSNPAPAKAPEPHHSAEEELAAAWGSDALSGDVMPPDHGADTAAQGGENTVLIANAPPLVPSDHTPGATAKFDPGEPENIETIAARRTRQALVERNNRRTLLQQMVSMPVLIAALLGILALALQTRV